VASGAEHEKVTSVAIHRLKFAHPEASGRQGGGLSVTIDIWDISGFSVEND
jgi:hypothetical protein